LLLFKIGLRSAISCKRFWRELSIDVAKHRSILKIDGVMRILVSFQDRPTFSQRFRRECSIDVAEHRSILKNDVVMRILVSFQDRPTFSQRFWRECSIDVTEHLEK